MVRLVILLAFPNKLLLNHFKLPKLEHFILQLFLFLFSVEFVPLAVARLFLLPLLHLMCLHPVIVIVIAIALPKLVEIIIV